MPETELGVPAPAGGTCKAIRGALALQTTSNVAVRCPHGHSVCALPYKSPILMCAAHGVHPRSLLFIITRALPNSAGPHVRVWCCYAGKW